MLERDPEKRPSAAALLRHPWLAALNSDGASGSSGVGGGGGSSGGAGAEGAPLADTLVQRLQRYGTYGRLRQVGGAARAGGRPAACLPFQRRCGRGAMGLLGAA